MFPATYFQCLLLFSLKVGNLKIPQKLICFGLYFFCLPIHPLPFSIYLTNSKNPQKYVWELFNPSHLILTISSSFLLNPTTIPYLCDICGFNLIMPSLENLTLSPSLNISLDNIMKTPSETLPAIPPDSLGRSVACSLLSSSASALPF